MCLAPLQSGPHWRCWCVLSSHVCPRPHSTTTMMMTWERNWSRTACLLVPPRAQETTHSADDRRLSVVQRRTAGHHSCVGVVYAAVMTAKESPVPVRDAVEEVVEEQVKKTSAVATTAKLLCRKQPLLGGVLSL